VAAAPKPLVPPNIDDGCDVVVVPKPKPYTNI